MRAGQWIVSLIDSHIGILVLCGEHGPRVRRRRSRLRPHRGGHVDQADPRAPVPGDVGRCRFRHLLTRNHRSPDVLNSPDSLDIDRDAARNDPSAILAGGPCELSNGTVLYAVVDDVASPAQPSTEDPPPCVQAEALQVENRALRRAAKRAKRYEAKYRYRAKAAKAARYKQAAKHHRHMHAELRELTTALVGSIAANVGSAAARGRPAAAASVGLGQRAYDRERA